MWGQMIYKAAMFYGIDNRAFVTADFSLVRFRYSPFLVKRTNQLIVYIVSKSADKAREAGCNSSRLDIFLMKVKKVNY